MIYIGNYQIKKILFKNFGHKYKMLCLYVGYNLLFFNEL